MPLSNQVFQPFLTPYIKQTSFVSLRVSKSEQAPMTQYWVIEQGGKVQPADHVFIFLSPATVLPLGPYKLRGGLAASEIGPATVVCLCIQRSFSRPMVENPQNLYISLQSDIFWYSTLAVDLLLLLPCSKALPDLHNQLKLVLLYYSKGLPPESSAPGCAHRYNNPVWDWLLRNGRTRCSWCCLPTIPTVSSS